MKEPYMKSERSLIIKLTSYYTDEGWSPYLSLDDALKLDDVRNALRRGDLQTASRLAHVFTLTPLALGGAGEQGAAPDRQ